MSSWRVRRIDPDMWLPIEEVHHVRSASIKRSINDGSCPLLESGEITLSDTIDEGYYRIELLRSSGDLINIATLLFLPDDSDYSFGAWNGSASGRSVLAPAAEKKFKPGIFAPKGVDAPTWAADKLREAIKAPVSVEGSFKLGEHVVFDLGSSYLDGVWKVLDVGGFCIQIAGDGSVTIRSKAQEPSLIITSDGKGLSPKITRSLPIDDVPNVLKVYEGANEATARNDDPESPTSTVSRGREIEVVEDSPTKEEGESLANYTSRRLAELSEVYETFDVEREFVDGIYPYSIVRVNLPAPGVAGDLRIMSQDIECEYDINVGETWGRLANGSY